MGDLERKDLLREQRVDASSLVSGVRDLPKSLWGKEFTEVFVG